MNLRKIFFVLGTIAIVLTLIPFIALDNWWIRMFDFPHVQLTSFTLIAIVCYLFRFNIRKKKDYLFLTIMLACFIFQLIKIIPYTPFHSKEMLASQTAHSTKDIALYTANVLQKNKERQKLIKTLKASDPDIVLLCEVDQGWLDDLEPFMNETFEFQELVPQDNTYGIALYSKLKLLDTEVKFLVDERVPSIHTKFKLRNEDTIQLYGIHPTPPLPQHNPKSSDRDTEMLLTARLASASKYPVVVLGDFNDVAWSNTTKLFKATSMLLDPRIGRGFYNTFSTDSYIMRWPVDHVFASAEFRLHSMRLVEDINSDHFPTFIQLSYEPELKKDQRPQPPTKGQLSRAASQIKAFNKTQEY